MFSGARDRVSPQAVQDLLELCRLGISYLTSSQTNFQVLFMKQIPALLQEVGDEPLAQKVFEAVGRLRHLPAVEERRQVCFYEHRCALNFLNI